MSKYKYPEILPTGITLLGASNKWSGSVIARCICGNTFHVTRYALRNKLTKSCGCLKREEFKKRVTTHGLSKTPIYVLWAGMINRCTYITNISYPRYGGRGIKVCDSWKYFENFYADMGNKPTPRSVLDRIDNNLGYCKENCRWVTYTQSNRNATSNKEIWGIKLWKIVEVGRKFNIPKVTIWQRLCKRKLNYILAFKPTKNIKSDWVSFRKEIDSLFLEANL